jgi:tetratricopeptide (TPR) repeat protein
LNKVQESLDAVRNKEIARLMYLLEKDPDQGLRYALPIGGNKHRGTAPPSGRLGERNVNFSLQRLGGGGPADAWEIEAEYQRRLTTRYLELANREIRLGRHRRAAYIFAELLGDLSAAASALCSGRHWREAAVLYEQRLQQPAAAVECLEQGGLWEEAIELLVKLRWQERAGDLCTRLKQIDRAEKFYLDEIEAHQIRGDRLSAARIYDEKLQQPQHALVTL